VWLVRRQTDDWLRFRRTPVPPVERFQKIIPDKVTLDSVLSDADVIFSAQGNIF
jgi:hypothetical protein